MAASGVNKTVAKKAYKNAADDIVKLETHIKNLKAHIEAMNKDIWYGSEPANKWYTKVGSHFNSLVTFDNGVTSFQNSLQTVFKKASTKGIQF